MARTPSVSTQMRQHLDEFGWCRANQHNWIPPTENKQPGQLVRENKVILATFVCDHCGSKRKDVVSQRTGELLGRTYEHMHGYVLKLQGTEKPTKSDWRKAHYNNIFNGR